MENTMTTKKAILVLGSVLFLVALMLVVPAKSVGLRTSSQSKLILRSPDELYILKGDENKNGTPDWKDMLTENTPPALKEAASKAVVSDATKKALEDPNNLTASFSKDIYTTSAYASQKGTLTQTQQEELAAKIVDETSNKISFKTYELSDLHLVKNEDSTILKKYINDVGTIYTKAISGDMQRDDLALVQAYNVKKDASILEAFVVKKNILDTAITSLLAVPVPYSAASYHLMILNKLSVYATIIENLSQADTDPLRAAIAFNSYIPSLKSLASSFISFQGYITSTEVVLTTKDAGFVLTSGYTQ
jgi:hypothetical protein